MKAYPFQHKDPTTGLTNISTGMDLRDAFAIAAIQGMLANPSLFDEHGEFQESNIKVAFAIADVAMQERKA
jgi:hypothetical protein